MLDYVTFKGTVWSRGETWQAANVGDRRTEGQKAAARLLKRLPRRHKNISYIRNI